MSQKRPIEYSTMHFKLQSARLKQLFIINVIEEFGLTIQSWEKHDSIIKEIEQNSKGLIGTIQVKASVPRTYNSESSEQQAMPEKRF